MTDIRSLGQLKQVPLYRRSRVIELMPQTMRDSMANLALLGRQKRIEEAAEFADLERALRGDPKFMDLDQEAEAAWKEHSIGLVWRDEVQRYGEYRMFLAGYAAAKASK